MLYYMNRLLALQIKSVCFSGEAHIEFCCHLARGNIDPKEPPVYEYVKFVGDFKFHNNGKESYSSDKCAFSKCCFLSP